jgi:hypothetical protein
MPGSTSADGFSLEPPFSEVFSCDRIISAGNHCPRLANGRLLLTNQDLPA